MSAEQLLAFLEVVKADAGLEQKLKGAGDLDAAVAMAKEAGFDVSKADWLNRLAQWLKKNDTPDWLKAETIQVLEMSDEELAEEELAGVVGGGGVKRVFGEHLGQPPGFGGLISF